MTPVKVGLVVEGHGEVKAAPILFRRIANDIDPTVNLEVLQPIRRPRGSLVNKPDEHELERAVELAALKARPRGGVFVLLDSDDDCPAELAPRLLARAEPAGMGLPVSVVLPQREFECWFLAAAESLAGRGELPNDLSAPVDPESIRGAKEWLSSKMPQQVRYVETRHQKEFSRLMDINQARRSRSFRKFEKEIGKLIADRYAST